MSQWSTLFKMQLLNCSRELWQLHVGFFQVGFHVLGIIWKRIWFIQKITWSYKYDANFVLFLVWLLGRGFHIFEWVLRKPKNRSKNKIKLWNHPKRIIYHLKLVCLRRPYNQPTHLYGTPYWFSDRMMRVKHNIYKHFSGVSARIFSLLKKKKILKNNRK